MKTAALNTAEQLSHEVAVLYYSRSSDVDNWMRLTSSRGIDLPARKSVDLPRDHLCFAGYRSNVRLQAASPARAPEWPIPVASDRPSELRTALGTGPTRSSLPRLPGRCGSRARPSPSIAAQRCWTRSTCSKGGSQYHRLIEAFQRVFGATIFFGTNTQLKAAPVFHQVRFNFMSEARIWYGRNFEQPNLPGDCQNMIVLTPEFYREVTPHPIPTDLQPAKALSCAPSALDLFTWRSYRCFIAKGEEGIPLFGEFGLVSQLGSGEYRRPRKFRERLENWLGLVKALWPSCPARISADGVRLIVAPATAMAAAGGEDVRA
jgi:hypothetical protein